MKDSSETKTKNGRRFYGHGIPRVKCADLAGKLIVVEGTENGAGNGKQTGPALPYLFDEAHH